MDMSGKFTPAEAFDTIEETILPSLSLVLDSLIEAAALALQRLLDEMQA